MIKVALCDDDRMQATYLEENLLNIISKHTELNIDIDIFESGESLLKNIIAQGDYQILFLDIEMPGRNGIEIAKEIRKLSRKGLIVYVTSYDFYTLQSFEVTPFRYLLKPVESEVIEQVFLAAIDDIFMNHSYLFFKYKNSQYQVDTEEILCLCSENGRQINVKLSYEPDSVLYYGKIKDLEKQLNPLIFVKINRGVLVNFKYVKIIHKDEVHMINGERFTISRSRRKKVKESYRQFVERTMGI
ncbi:DNA-binding LytR/AlgR family response regulator [Enterococcus rotai]|uniref:Two-component system response regulator n=1 Tax=Enterococcus rotai TaxID=118060 RepID=A0A0U2X6A5_9ENTE|nr:LytTR family DNA-binding domain-containing protein [Enterococcus rotai]ALS35664.1 hypothetical protein ATZ35_00360 [Enterococcus rotai]